MVRQLLSENGIEPSPRSPAPGAGGRITRDDVLEGGRRPARPAPPRRPPPRAHSGAPAPVGTARPRRPCRRRRRRRPFRVAPGTRSCRSPTCAAAPPSTWCAPRRRRPHAFIANEVDFESVERVRNGLGRALQGRGGLLADLPALRGPGRGRGAARLPAAQRVGGRRLARRPRRGQPRHRGRPLPRGPDRAGDPPGRGGHPARRRPAHPRPGRAGAQPAAQRRRHRRRHVLHHQRRAVRDLLHGPDHQPAAGGHPGHRRHRPPARSW